MPHLIQREGTLDLGIQSECPGAREVTMWIHSWKWKWKWNTAMRCSFEVNQSCCTDPPCRRSIWSFELALYRHNMPATDNHASNMLIWLVEWAWKASHLIGYPDSHAKQPPNFHRALGPMGMPSLLNPLPLESWPRKNMILKYLRSFL